MFEFAEQFAKTPVPFRFRFLQAMQIFDGEERVLINRVAMIKITHHEHLDTLEFRQQQRQQAKRVHGAQSIGGMRLHQRLLQIKPQLGPTRRCGSQRGQRLLDFEFSGRA